MAKNELVTPLGDSAMDDTNNALKVTLATNIAGERLQDQATKSYLEVRQAANANIISKTSAVTIGGGEGYK